MTSRNTERILVVDDDPRNVRLLEGMFRSAGYVVDKAYGGVEALQKIDEVPPDLVLLDVMMPGMSGHDVCLQLKGQDRTRPIPVVLVTSLSSTEDKVQGLDIGADDFVSKPVNRLELLAKTRSLLRIKLLHDELAKANEQLERRNQDLLRLEEMKESLMQMIVHDLKNPLTAIMGNLSLVLQSPAPRPAGTNPDESGIARQTGTGVASGSAGAAGPAAPDWEQKTRRRVGVALESSRAMMRMILDLLDIARLEESAIVLDRRRVPIMDVMEASIQENGGLLTSAKISVERQFPAGGPEVWADAGLLGRIVGNLLSNAIKHTPDGGRITLGSLPREQEMVFFVRDTGEGIDAASQQLIFEKFRQAESRKHGLKSDRGLGLAFCKMAVEAHGGRIWLDSAPGQGSTFYVALPHATDDAADGPGMETPSIVSVGSGSD
jgi:signal transduction histidine kinase